MFDCMHKLTCCDWNWFPVEQKSKVGTHTELFITSETPAHGNIFDKSCGHFIKKYILNNLKTSFLLVV